ncbi:RNA-directed DNA polymerase [Pseudooceanicola nanhaiensis]|uniref:RNA-directed DNA polymerase n=1 Tax=Pseudooceanicola nanhaiensis TaxID=375761 RepID=UPI00355A386D
MAIDHVIENGSDDIFQMPIFSGPIEHDIIKANEQEFRKTAYAGTLEFLKRADLRQVQIGPARRSLVVRNYKSFRQVSWLDPFDIIKYLSVAVLLFEKVESSRVEKARNIVHSHRRSDDHGKIFDRSYGYGTFRKEAGRIARENPGKWLVSTDISNFFDRIGNHSLENHLLDIGCDRKLVILVREMLLYWSGDRRSFGLPVGSDGSRILSEAVLIDIDRKLIECGFRFVRYVDDFRFLADSQSQAHHQLLVLTELLAEEGLALNASKTGVSKITEDFETALVDEDLQKEHEPIDESAVVERRVQIRVSGRSTYSKRFEKPGVEALRKLKKLSKEEVLNAFLNSSDLDFESNVKLVVKYFVYVSQEVSLLEMLISTRKTTIFYICDALVKEADKFDDDKRREVVKAIEEAESWSDAAYPYLMPLLRLFAHEGYRNDALARAVFDNHKLEGNMIFFREYLMVAYSSLDRQRMRKLAIDLFGLVPDFVQRVIYLVVERHKKLSEDERRPLLKNMKQSSMDWFLVQK